MIKALKILERTRLEKLLNGVTKPGRYIGSETGIKSKNIHQLRQNCRIVTAALVFPDVYEIGMSNLGLQILYEIINQNPSFSAERVFSPWTDFEKNLRKEKTNLFSLENRIFLDCFDLIGFNSAHEMLYTNILNIIDLSGLKIRSSERKNLFPLICAGGSSVANPWPLSKFMDFMVIGDGEEVIAQIMAVLYEFKLLLTESMPVIDVFKNSTVDIRDPVKARNEILKKLSRLDGVFVPAFYKIIYHTDCTVESIKSIAANKKASPGIQESAKVKKATVKDIGRHGFLAGPVVPNIGTVHDRLNMEIMRGCLRGCRFCQAGFTYRPARYKKAEDIVLGVSEQIKKTGYDEVSFTSLSSSDYPQLGSLVESMCRDEEFEGLSISLPSLRLDSFSLKILELIQSGRKTGLTFAPEAGSQRMRNIIKKDISHNDMIKSIELAVLKGWERIKLYFMIGLPFESTEDVLEIPKLIDEIIYTARNKLSGKSIGRFRISVSINPFCPKPFTPFQWAAQNDICELEEKINALKSNISKKFVKLHYNDPRKSKIECALSRGDTKTCDVIELAWKKGSIFDNWTDYFNYGLWLQCFEDNKINMDFYTTRQIPEDELLPWDIIKIGTSKRFFLNQFKAAKENSCINHHF